eukprot:CAMPEP_0205951612 /NCGR_PEP_ID=MMETSP1459-20131121/3063_1 /ASSEMBLY_ACC=CAM_ASM_001120 /TAXON_ID=41880 /ORGANISM="Pycnococcus provasolii, Strain RCC931" /LENGTH=120 /DNA_ID=CAMNT_0053323335 /DNA_START=250 /DNA_END=609 /DNA_ORIENTATION=+
MSSESESTAANSNNDEQQQIKMTRMAEWRKKADAAASTSTPPSSESSAQRNTCFPLVSSLTTSSRMPGMMGKAYIAMNLSTPCCVGLMSLERNRSSRQQDICKQHVRRGGEIRRVRRHGA